MASKNEEDIQLLYNNPRALLEKYQRTISMIVQNSWFGIKVDFFSNLVDHFMSKSDRSVIFQTHS